VKRTANSNLSLPRSLRTYLSVCERLTCSGLEVNGGVLVDMHSRKLVMNWGEDLPETLSIPVFHDWHGEAGEFEGELYIATS